MEDRSILTWASAGTRACLFESITSFLENAEASGKQCSVVLATNNTSISDLEKLSDSLLEVTSKFDAPGAISTFVERQAAMQKISPSFDPEIVRWILLPDPGIDWFIGPGANQNAMLLAYAGSVFSSTDDDILLRPAGLPTAELRGDHDYRVDPTDLEGFDWNDAFLPAHIRYRVSKEDAADWVEPVERDVVADHQQVLGRTVASHRADGSVRAGVVRISTPGAYGDSGMGAARTILGLDGITRELNIQIDEAYRSHRYSRNMVRIPERNYVGTGTHLMGMHIGLDNTELLPPMAPFGRNADGIFAVVTRIIDRRSLTAFFDYGLFHDAPPRQPFSKEELLHLHATNPDIMMALLVHNRPSRDVTDPADRMRYLGSVLVEIASLPISEFQTVVHELWSRSFYDYAERLEGLLERYNREPPEWAVDIDTHLEIVYERLREPTSIFPARSGHGSAEQARRLTKIYGTILEMWPDLWEYFAERNRTGQEPILTRDV